MNPIPLLILFLEDIWKIVLWNIHFQSTIVATEKSLSRWVVMSNEAVPIISRLSIKYCWVEYNGLIVHENVS